MSDPRDELEPLDPASKSLLSALPSPALAPELKAKLWSRVEASALALPPAAAAVQAAPTVAPAAKVVGVGAAGKLLVPAVIGAIVAGAGGGIAIERAWHPPQEKVVIRYVDVPRPHDEPVVVPPPPAPVVAPPLPAPVVKPKPAPTHAVVASAEERNLVELARTALIKRDPAGALQAVAQHREKFPRGQLSEEIDSLEVQALLQAGRSDDASAAAKKFLARYPHSVFEDAVRAALK